jgi:hypothetical protein
VRGLSEQRLAGVSQAPALPDGQKQLVLAVVAALMPLVAQITQLDRQIRTAVREHPDGEIFLSLFEDRTA